MKHTLKVTITLVVLFFLSQFMGMVITNEYIDHEKTAETGVTTWEELPYDFERPPVEENKSFILIITAVLIETGLLLLLVRFKKVMWWKVWFFLSVLICLTIALNPFLGQHLAFLVGLIFAIIKVFKPNIIVHNITEVFIYGGLAAIFVPIMNMYSVFILLFLISAYDIYAVWKSKHMIKLAKFQTESKVFAGLSIPYNPPKQELKKDKKIKVEKIEKIKTAILGGGDVAFPLLFAGVAMKTFGFFVSLIIPLFATIALVFLFIKSKKDKFYPAMPFLTAGCLVGYGIIILFF
jgi:presenilin-like A22 family membrane protease